MPEAPSLRQDDTQVECERIRSKACLYSFTCGIHEIDRHARGTAFKMDETGRARVLGAYGSSGQCHGYVCLSFGRQTSPKLLDQRDRDLWRHEAPVVNIDFLAVHLPMQRQGLGRVLLIEALKLTHAVSQLIPVYGVSLNSLNEHTTDFYKKMGFKVAPNEKANPLMILPIWSIEDLFGDSDGDAP